MFAALDRQEPNAVILPPIVQCPTLNPRPLYTYFNI